MLTTLSSSISNFCSKYYLSPLDNLLACKPFSIKDPSSRHALIGTINALLVSVSFYFSMCAINRTSQPLSSVLSGSMIPTMYRGDILILSKNVGKTILVEKCTKDHDVENGESDEQENKKITVPSFLKYGNLNCGDIIIYNVDSLKKRTTNNNNNSAPPSVVSTGDTIVHRIISIHIDDQTGETFVLTKGDNNAQDDRQFIYPGPHFFIPLNDETFGGKVVARIPFIGHGSVFVQERLGIVGKLAILGVALGLAYYVESADKKKSVMS